MLMEVAQEWESIEEIQLEPFIHQVGGHSSILSLDESTICKPLVLQEVEFYKSLPSNMREFTAEFRGIVEVSSVQDENGAITLLAKAPTKIVKPQKRSRNPKHKLRILESGRVEIEAQDNDVLFVECDQKKGTKRTLNLNPWVEKCHAQHLNEVAGRRYAESKITHKFIVLENLTSKIKYPCVLDLKMGTRNFGDDAPPSKIRSQQAKGAATTTAKLGVRICGMQVYQANTGGFLCWDKYDGRALKVENFQDALCQFLNNGKVFHRELLPKILTRLKRLRHSLETLDTFRFYCSSLLIIYEGSPSLPAANKSSYVDLHDSPDEDLHFLQESLEERATDVSLILGAPDAVSTETGGQLLIKLIDFAHATCKNVNNTDCIHSGPDRGLIFGVDNLISIFQNILDECGRRA